LDNKIELILQMNCTLEKIALAIFHNWFVEFKFPNFDGELLNGLPNGWKSAKLGDICQKITKGTTPTTLKKQFVEQGINFVKVEAIDDLGNFLPEKFSFIDKNTNDLLKRSIFQENDIVFTIAGTLGRIAKVDKSILPANTNQAVAIIRLHENDLVNFIYYLLKSDTYKNKILSKAVHAVQANISLGVLSNTDIILPNIEILSKFDNIVQSISNQIISNTYQMRLLIKLRDALLPKLMSGKLQVSQ